MPNSNGDSNGAAGIRVSGLVKSFGAHQVLHGVDLSVRPGEVLALLGPSGCGKTTLLRTIAGLEAADGGSIRFGERLVAGPGMFVPPEKRRVGLVFQDWALFPHMSVGRNVGFGLSRDERRNGRVEEALRLVDLAGFGARNPAELSGGQRQRVALARALATRPSLLLLDEPFSNLDAALRVQVRGEVQRLLADLDVTAVFVTHDQEEAFVVGDQVAVMLGGKVAQQAAPAELYRAPASAAVARFVGDPNLLPGSGVGRHADTPVGRVALREEATGPVEVLLRPEELTLTAGGDATIESVEYYGHDAVYAIRPAQGPTVRVRVISAPAFGRGDRVGLTYTGGPAVAYSSA